MIVKQITMWVNDNDAVRIDSMSLYLGNTEIPILVGDHYYGPSEVSDAALNSAVLWQGSVEADRIDFQFADTDWPVIISVDGMVGSEVASVKIMLEVQPDPDPLIAYSRTLPVQKKAGLSPWIPLGIVAALAGIVTVASRRRR